MLGRIVRFSVTAAIVAAATLLGHSLWLRYMDAPWMRDARVRADVISVSPDVAGMVTELKVIDNQLVHRGDVLFLIDRDRYKIALDQAAAALEGARTEAALREEEARRRAALDAVVVSSENQQAARSAAAMAGAKVREAQAAVSAAQLNLQRTRVLAPVDGYVVNLNVHPGDYAVVGRPLMAVVDRDSFRVEAYFEETKVPRVHAGDYAVVRMLGSGLEIGGRVDGMAKAISESDVAGLLSAVNPTFHWVRLAQRIPVTIKLDRVPDSLASGMTCTVIVRPQSS